MLLCCFFFILFQFLIQFFCTKNWATCTCYELWKLLVDVLELFSRNRPQWGFFIDKISGKICMSNITVVSIGGKVEATIYSSWPFTVPSTLITCTVSQHKREYNLLAYKASWAEFVKMVLHNCWVTCQAHRNLNPSNIPPRMDQDQF